MEKLTIGQVAKGAQVKVDTIRYYERRGLMPEPQRRESGYRQYAEEDILRIQFIKRAQDLGFTLNEIDELLRLRVDSAATCEDVREQAEAKIEDISAKIDALTKMKKVLINLVTACNARAATSECPILESLEARGK